MTIAVNQVSGREGRVRARRAALSLAWMVRLEEAKDLREATADDGLTTKTPGAVKQRQGTTDRPHPCTLRGRPPQLESLSLNGSSLTTRGVRMFVAAVVGGLHAPPNRRLAHVDRRQWTWQANTQEQQSEQETEERERQREARARGGPNFDTAHPRRM